MAAPILNSASRYMSRGRRDSNKNYGLLSASSSDSEDFIPPTMGREVVPAPAKKWVQRVGFTLLPSFIQKKLRPSMNKPRRLYPTSWLDGLRGVAAFIVVLCHYTEANMGWFTESYGINETGPKSAPVQLPFLRVIYSGRPMVHIFFVISGYVLSYKPLKLIRSRNYSSLATTLSSSVFRRALRLFLPTTVSTFIVFLCIRWNLCGDPFETFWEQFVDWTNAIWQITYSWRWDLIQGIPYDAHLWTIPIEMSFSLFLFVTIIGLARCKTWVRLSLLFLIMNYCMKSRHWAGTEFLGGMAIAEISLIQDEARAASEASKESASPYFSPEPSSAVRISKLIAKALLLGALTLGLFLAGWPNSHGDITPGIRWFYDRSPEPFYSAGGDLVSYPWYSLAAILIVFSLQNLKFLQRLFTTPIAQYLGCISYSIYMMHGPVLDVFAKGTIDFLWSLTAGPQAASMADRMFVWTGGILILMPLNVWAADVFWRHVDQPLVDFSRWLETVCIVHENDAVMLP